MERVEPPFPWLHLQWRTVQMVSMNACPDDLKVSGQVESVVLTALSHSDKEGAEETVAMALHLRGSALCENLELF